MESYKGISAYLLPASPPLSGRRLELATWRFFALDETYLRTEQMSQRSQLPQLSLQVPSRHQPRETRRKEQDYRGHQVQSEGVRRSRFHDPGHTMIKHSPREQDPDKPACPRRNGFEGVKKMQQKQRTQSIGYQRKSLQISVAPVKSLAHGFDD